MADIAIFRINYKSDFILTLQSDAGWMTPFCIKFWTGAPSQAYFAGYDGTTYTHCAPVDGDPTKLSVQFDDHHLPIGDMKFQIGYHFTVADFPTSIEDEVINQAAVIIDNDGEQQQVMLDFNGETAPEIAFAMPAYANEAQRIANEQARIAAEEQRVSNEQQRISNEEGRISAEESRQENEQQRIHNEETRIAEFASLKAEAIAATGAANDAATFANEKAQLAADKAALAQTAATLANDKAQLAADKASLAQASATLANDKAALAQQKAEYAQAQGDYAKAQSDIALADHERAETDHERAEADHDTATDDHTTATSDHTQAESDHTRAEADHTTAASDHTQASSDHDRAESDHTQAGQDHTRAESDHTTAAADHTRAESDHTRAESDHAAVEAYVDSLGAFDISAYNATGGVLAKYADLTAALGTNGANIPDELRKGGMSVKFVLSSDNKYIQARCMAQNFTTDVTQWQVVDSGSLISYDTDIATKNTVLLDNAYDVTCNSANCRMNMVVFGSNTSNKHAYIPVVPGEKYHVDGIADYVFRIAFATTNEVTPGDAIPVVAGTSVIEIPANTNVWITIPKGCSYLLLWRNDEITNFVGRVKKAIGVDEIPTRDSKNILTSGGAAKLIKTFVLHGNGNDVVTSPQIKVKGGNIYRVWVHNTDVNYSEVSIGSNKIGFYQIYSAGTSEKLFAFEHSEDEVRYFEDYYDFKVDSGAEAVTITLRANKGEEIALSLEDITLDIFNDTNVEDDIVSVVPEADLKKINESSNESSKRIRIDGVIVQISPSSPALKVSKFNVGAGKTYIIKGYNSSFEYASYAFYNGNSIVSVGKRTRYVSQFTTIVTVPEGADYLYISCNLNYQDAQCKELVVNKEQEREIYLDFTYDIIKSGNGDFSITDSFDGLKTVATPRFIKSSMPFTLLSSITAKCRVFYYNDDFSYINSELFNITKDTPITISPSYSHSYIKIHLSDQNNAITLPTVILQGNFDDDWDVFNQRPSDDGYHRISVLVNVTNPTCCDTEMYVASYEDGSETVEVQGNLTEVGELPVEGTTGVIYHLASGDTAGFYMWINSAWVEVTLAHLIPGDTQQLLPDYGVIALPVQYKNTGEPTRLIIYCHGAAVNYSSGVTRFNSQDLEPNYWLAEGYAVMDVEGNPFNNADEHMYIPQAQDSYVAAYKWAIEHYNLRRDGVFIGGRSMGGGMTISLIRKECDIPIIAACPNVPNPGMPFNQNATRKTFWASHCGLVLPNGFEFQSGYVNTEKPIFLNNWDRWIKYIALFSLISELPISDNDKEEMIDKLWLGNVDGRNNYLKTFHGYAKVPVKFFAINQDLICLSWAEVCYRMLINSGQITELRKMNSFKDYSGTGTTAHHADTQDPALRTTVTTRFGVEMTNVPIVYIEMLQFWRRYEQGN